MNKKEKNKLIITIVAVLFLGFMVSGGTFAYFQWSSGTSDRTSINVTIDGGQITMHIEPEETVMSGLRPTKNCNNSFAYIDSLVKVDNNTGADAVPSFKLKVRVTKGGSGELTKEALSHINYQVELLGSKSVGFKPTKPSGTVTCSANENSINYDNEYSNAQQQYDALLFNQAEYWSSRLRFESVNTDGSWTDIPNTNDYTYTHNGWEYSLFSSPAYIPRQYYLRDTVESDGGMFDMGATEGVTFVAAPHATTYQWLRVYVWIDEGYTATTIGNVISDPLQNAKIEITYSEQSTIQQVSSNSIGVQTGRNTGLYTSNGTYTSWNNLVANGSIEFYEGNTSLLSYVDPNLTGELVIPNSVASIEGNAFSDSSLTSVVIPKSVTWISFDAFFGSQITDVYYDGTDADWENVYSDGDDLGVNIHYLGGETLGLHKADGTFISWDTLVANGDIVVDENGEITSVSDNLSGDLKLPNSVTGSTYSAFEFKNLTSLEIPKSITSLDYSDFWGLAISEISYRGTMAEWNLIELSEDWMVMQDDAAGYVVMAIRKVICLDGIIEVENIPENIFGEES